MDFAQMYGLTADDIEVLDSDTVLTLVRQYQETGDHDCLNQIIQHNLRLVKTCTCRLIGMDHPLYEDCLQEGVIGMMKAIDRFDFSRNTKFSTYAVQWILQAVGRFLHDNGDTIRKPVHLLEHYGKINRFIKSFNSEYGLDPSDETVGEALGIPAKKVRSILEWKTNCVSLDKEVANNDNDSDTTLGDFISDKVNVEEEAEKNMLTDYVSDVIYDVLDQRTADIIAKRWGVGQCAGKPGRTLESVAMDYGVTRERIRQIEEKGFKKLFFAFRKAGLRDYLVS